MRLALKFALILSAGILMVLGVDAFIRIERERSLFETDIRRDSTFLGQWLARAIEEIWSSAGEREALGLLARAAGESSVRIRWIWLDAPEGDRFRPGVDPRLLGEVKAGRTVTLKIDEEQGQGLYTYVPVSVPEAPRGAIELRESLAQQSRYVRRTVQQELATTAVLVTVCGVLTTLLGIVFVGRPIRLLVKKARRIGAGDLSGRIQLRQQDEIGELAAEMNAMSEMLQQANEKATREEEARRTAVEQLRHADRLSTVGKLASGIAHELGTPLSVITGRAQLIVEASPAGSPARDNATIIREQAQRMATIIRQLLDFARRRKAQKGRHDLRPIARQTIGMLQSLADKRGVSVVLDDGSPVIASVDIGPFQQALTNLVVNGIQAMPHDGRVTVRMRQERATPPRYHEGVEGDYIRIDVEDEGPGMSKETLDHIFEPFFTTKPVGEGTGLGLSVAYGIVREHGGWIAVESQPGNGARFSIFLPKGEDL